MKSRFPPGPDGGDLGLANLIRYQVRGLDFLAELAATYGDLVYLELGGTPIYLLNHPDLVKQVMLDDWQRFRKPELIKASNRGHWGDGLTTLEGDAWRARRRLMQPAFHERRIAAFAPVIVACVEEALQAWPPGPAIHLGPAMLTLTARIAARVLFDAEVEGFGPAGANRDRAGVIPLAEALGEDFSLSQRGDGPTSLVLTRRRAGQELSELERELLTYAEALAQLNQKPFLYMIQLYRQAALNLIGPAENACRLAGESYDEEKMLPLHQEVNHQAAINFLYLSKLFLCYLFQQPRAALEHADTAEKYLPSTMGMVTVPVFYFYDALARLAVYPEADPAERVEILARVAADQDKMENWARHAPMNHRHKYLLVEAERARVLGQDSQARDYFDQAIDLAREHGYLHEEGLANELAGQFYLARGQARVAEHYLRDAHYAYLHWGAAAKVEELKTRYPQFLAQDTAPPRATVMATPQTAPRLSSALDLGSVLKASQAISGEIVLERLLTRLMRIVIENAGAQKGYLILEKKGQSAREPASRDVALADLAIEAEGTVDQAEVIAPADAAVERSGKVPVAIVNYVARTRENVVLNDATREGIFTQDPYLTLHQPKSILCMPLISQGKLNGIVYLENNLSAGAFTPDRQEVLRLLSGQAAISIANAKLYAHQVELTNAASRFVPHEFLTLLNKESLVEIKLGDHVQMEMTILVSDIRSFTTMSEKMTPQENFDFINAYWQWVAPVIRQNRGFIGKYMGDGIMAFFPGAADRAVRASIDILKQISRFNAERQAKRHAHGPVQTGIGLHTGSVMLGTVGEEGRMQGDVMSDAANLANRLEGLTKFYGASLVVSAETLHQLEDPGRYRVRFLGKLRVKGRQEAVSVFEILDGEPAPGIDLKLQTKSAFEQGLSLYYAAQFNEAKAHFEAVLRSHPQDLAAARYLRQATEYLERGAPEEWTGVEVITEK